MIKYRLTRKADGNYTIVKSADNVITHTRARLSQLWEISKAIDEFGRRKNEPNKDPEPATMRITDTAVQSPRHA